MVPDTPAALEVVYDPEDEHGEPELFARIETTLSAEEALLHLDRLDEGWWLDAVQRGRFILQIDVWFV